MTELGQSTPTGESATYSDYFSQIPLWNADGQTKRFEVMADRLGDRIPVTRLESWRQFSELLESDFFRRQDLVFRGHRRHDWGLMPTLGRVTRDGIVTKPLADAQLERFKRAVRGRLHDTALLEDDDEMWSVGQHHGLMTPLLDWTYSPYVALFFAFQKEDPKKEQDNPYRAVYVLDKRFLANPAIVAETGIRVVEPRLDHYGRLVNQAGLFTYSPPDATIENKLTNVLADDEGITDEDLRNASEDEQPGLLARYICKIYIRNDDRDNCVQHLRRMNVHHASLFPDLIGASDYCNILASEVEQAAEIERQARRIASVGSTPIEAPVEAPFEAPAIGLANTDSIESLLRAPPAAQQVEPGRVGLIALELAKALGENQVVDWDKRDAVQARLRNAIRVVLRRYGYPSVARDAVAEQVLALAKQTPAEPA